MNRAWKGHLLWCCALLMTVHVAAATEPETGKLLSLDVDQRGSWSAPRPEWNVAPSTPEHEMLTWHDFIREVLAANLDYAAAQYDVDIAAADAAAARLLPNPHLSLAGNRDLTYHDKYGTGSDGQPALLRQVESRSVGLDLTIETASKRKWRSLVADQSLRSAAATLDDFLRNLKLDAASGYVDALAAQTSVGRLSEAAEFLARLEHAQEQRLAAGDIGKPDLTQTQLEQAQIQNDLVNAQARAQSARLALATFLGRDRGRTDFDVRGNLDHAPSAHDLSVIIPEALAHRPDLIALRHARDAADSGVTLARSQRVPDIDFTVTYADNDGVALNHPIDPTPGFRQLALGIEFPIPLFDQGREQLRRALAADEQAKDRLAAAELRAEVEIRTADAQYVSARRRLDGFRGGILQSADTLLEAKRFSYQRGAATLLELLEAQRSANEVRQDYELALADATKAQIELERAADIDLELALD